MPLPLLAFKFLFRLTWFYDCTRLIDSSSLLYHVPSSHLHRLFFPIGNSTSLPHLLIARFIFGRAYLDTRYGLTRFKPNRYCFGKRQKPYLWFNLSPIAFVVKLWISQWFIDLILVYKFILSMIGKCRFIDVHENGLGILSSP